MKLRCFGLHLPRCSPSTTLVGAGGSPKHLEDIRLDKADLVDPFEGTDSFHNNATFPLETVEEKMGWIQTKVILRVDL